MSHLLVLAVLALLTIPLVVAIRRSTELFVVQVRHGEPRLVRGRLPHRLYNDLCDVLARARVQEAQLRVVVEGGTPRLRPSQDISRGTEQQLRNVIGTFPIAKIRAGGRRASR